MCFLQQEKIKRCQRQKTNRKIKKRQQQKQKKKHVKKQESLRKFYSNGGHCFFLPFANFSLQKRLINAGADMQKYGTHLWKGTPKFLYAKGLKCKFLMDFSDWGSWGGCDYRYYIHVPSGWVVEKAYEDRTDSIMSPTKTPTCEETWMKNVPIYRDYHYKL